MSSHDTSSSASPATRMTTQVPPCLYDVTPLYNNETLPAKASNEEKAPYYERELEACTLIQLKLPDKPLSGVLDATDTKETWNRLYSRYQDNCKHTIAFITGEQFRTHPPMKNHPNLSSSHSFKAPTSLFLSAANSTSTSSPRLSHSLRHLLTKLSVRYS
jgi:hypothetical protein